MGKKKEYNLSEIDPKQAEDASTDKKESFTVQEYDGNTILTFIRHRLDIPISKRSLHAYRLTREKMFSGSPQHKISSVIFFWFAFHVLAIVNDGVTDQPCKQPASDDGHKGHTENDSSGDADQTDGEGNFSTSEWPLNDLFPVTFILQDYTSRN